jgi:hypothetical protein
MPADSLFLSIAVSGVFLIFAVVLAWADRSTTRWQRAQASENRTSPAIEPPRKKAA